MASALVGQPLAGQRREQLVLPVAGDAGDAKDFAGRELERDAVELSRHADRPA